MRVIFYIWSLEKGDEQLIERIEAAFKQLLKDSTLPEEDSVVESEIIELASYGEIIHDGGIGIMFGTVRGIKDIHELVEELPSLPCLTNKPSNKKFREGAFEKLEMIVGSLVGEWEQGTEAQLGEPAIKKETHSYVKTDAGYTVGKKDTDFVIDEATTEYIRKIKDLIGGSAFMEKDGMRIEIK